MKITLYPKKKVAGYAISLLFTFLIGVCFISAVILLIMRKFVWLVVPAIIAATTEIVGMFYAWYISQEIEVDKDGRLKITWKDSVDIIGGNISIYSIGKIEKISRRGGTLKLKVSDSTVQNKPFKPKPCKRAEVLDCTEEAELFIRKFKDKEK